MQKDDGSLWHMLNKHMQKGDGSLSPFTTKWI
jgi:hypothetical protein